MFCLLLAVALGDVRAAAGHAPAAAPPGAPLPAAHAPAVAPQVSGQAQPHAADHGAAAAAHRRALHLLRHGRARATVSAGLRGSWTGRGFEVDVYGLGI